MLTNLILANSKNKSAEKKALFGRRRRQHNSHNDIQHNDTQHNETQHNDIQNNDNRIKAL